MSINQNFTQSNYNIATKGLSIEGHEQLQRVWLHVLINCFIFCNETTMLITAYGKQGSFVINAPSEEIKQTDTVNQPPHIKEITSIRCQC